MNYKLVNTNIEIIYGSSLISTFLIFVLLQATGSNNIISFLNIASNTWTTWGLI